MEYAFLAIAIVSEVIATSYLKQTEGFTKLTPRFGVSVKKSRGGTETVCGHVWQVQTQTYPAGLYL